MLVVRKENKSLKGEIVLTASKSESNRALMIQALSKEEITIENLATAKDTETFLTLLKTHKNVWDVGPAGTTFRFLTAYSAIQEGIEKTLTGSKRMLERPVKVLVDALREIGADIDYLGKEGYPPLKIKGKALQGGMVHMRGDVSSQFISAMLMIGPMLENGIRIVFTSEPTSIPYIKMTIKMMEHFGAEVNWEGKEISVQTGGYKANRYTIEADWSAASYWYEMAAFADELDLKIIGLKEESLQGDSAVSSLYKELGVQTTFEGNGVQLTKKALDNDIAPKDFVDYPDIAQTLSVSYAALGKRVVMDGLHSLRIKETDRIQAIQNELGGLGYDTSVEGDILTVQGTKHSIDSGYMVKTYHDHRMAMAFAPLAMVHDKVVIEDETVVVKSYPEYWMDLAKVGFEFE